MRARMRHFFLAGILVVLPSFITLYVFLFVFNTIGEMFRLYLTPLLKYVGIGEPPFYVYSALGILIIITFIISVGMITTNFIGRKIVAFGERLLANIPVLSKIYIAAKQMLEAFAYKEKKAFRQLVMVEYPRRGLYSLGFLTAKAQKSFQSHTSDELVNVFIPTTPNPTSGLLIIVPRKDVIDIDLSVEDGLKFIVSGGIVYPEPSAKITDSDNTDKSQ